MNEIEIWKDIPKYEGIYKVSNFGNIKRLGWTYKYKFIEEHLLNQTKNRLGYKTVLLCMDNNRKRYFVHRLIALAFLPNNKNKSDVNHIDGNPSNNELSNLEWATRSENHKHAYRILGRINPSYGKYGGNSHLAKPIIQYDKNMNFICRYDSITDAAKLLNIKCISAIVSCCKGRSHTSYGFIWRYEIGKK